TTIGNGSYMWLPSFGEVFNNTTSSYTSNTTTYIGQWGLNSTDRVFATSLYSSTSSTISYCWLRSGCSEYYGVYDRAMLVGSSGSAYSNGVTGSRGVRPAAHISLNELAAIASHTFDTNVFNTDGTINKEGTMALLDAVGYNPADTGTYTAHNIAGRTSDNSGSTIIFPMGYVDGTSGEPLYWKATYLHNNYLTIWLDKAYTSNIAWDSGDVNYTTYPSSTIQTYIDDTFWPLITQSNSTLQSIFATPTEVGYQLVGVGTQNDTSYYYSSSYTSTFDNMAYDTHFGSYMWLPSFGEVFNNTSSSYSSVNCTGLWGVNKTDRAFVTSLYKNSTSSTTSYCWLRSGYSNYSYYALYVFYTGSSCGAANAANGNGVRPAAHISLDVLANMFFKTISVESNNSAFGSVSGGGRYDNYTSATLTAIPNTGYAFEGWSLDGGNTIISTVNPYTFTVTKNETYTALFANTKIITLNINDSNLGIVRGGGKYSTNEIVELLAVPVSGCAFLYWIDSADPNTRISANPLNVTITEDKTYTAYFTDSLLNGVACVAEAGGEVRMNGYNDSDTSIHFSAVAYAGYTFDGWYIYGESTALSTAWSVDFEKSAINNKLIVAKFSETNAQVNTETNNTDKLT
ncbi:MAG: hypothetical protein IJ301_06025, partial [Clostridia bacterium]|nr:hypothetical protein [Clostridia bacterium]